MSSLQRFEPMSILMFWSWKDCPLLARRRPAPWALLAVCLLLTVSISTSTRAGVIGLWEFETAAGGLGHSFHQLLCE